MRPVSEPERGAGGGASRSDLEVVVVAGPDQVAAAAAATVACEASAAAAARGRFLMALSGGNTPAALYRLLAGTRFDHLPWGLTHLLWGDERCVASDDERSNYGLVARSGLLERPVAGVHRMRGEDRPEDAAAAYAQTLASLGGESPRPGGRDDRSAVVLDLVLLGLGDDGHTASLFPGAPALAEARRSVVATEEYAGSRRVTLTLPVLRAARRVLFLVAGEAKRDAVRRVVVGRDPSAPATLVVQGARVVTWIMDEAAAGADSRRC